MCVCVCVRARACVYWYTIMCVDFSNFVLTYVHLVLAVFFVYVLVISCPGVLQQKYSAD